MRRAIRALSWLLGLLALTWVARRADVRGAVPILTHAGPWMVLGLAPYVVQISLDARAWRVLLQVLGHRIRWRRLITVRLATEAVLLTMPGGSLIGESLKPYLLARSASVPIPDTVASVGIKRALLAGAQAVYLALALVIGESGLARASQSVVGTGSLPLFVAAAAVGLAVVAVGLAIAFTRGRIAERVRAVLVRIPISALRREVAARRERFAAADTAFTTLATQRQAVATAAALLLCAWLVEAGEAFVLCRLLGIELELGDVLAMEACVVFARNAAFVLPAGLGIQDAGYLAFLSAYGVAAPSAAAFAIVKRCKELAWIAIGYALLFLLDRHPTIVGIAVPHGGPSWAK
jgi:uncharacterized protein (TIRG00374 family)